jgi:MFS family permease
VLTRIKPSLYIPAAIFVWGGISMCMAAVQNFAGIVCVRVFLGFAESPFFPGALYVATVSVPICRTMH